MKRPTVRGRDVPCRVYLYRRGLIRWLLKMQDECLVLNRGSILRDQTGDWRLVAKLWRVT